MSPSNPPGLSLGDIPDNMRQAARAKSTADLALDTGTSTLRVIHLSNIVLRQRNMIYADRQPLTVGDSIGHLINLALTAFGLYINSTELSRRVGANEPQVHKKLDPAQVAVRAVAIGLGLAEAKNGRTLIKKRVLSTYGRVYQTLASVTTAAQLGLSIRSAM